MKKYFRYIAMFVIFIIGLVFMVNQRENIKSLDEDSNEIYLEYDKNRDDFNVTEGKITRIIDPHSSEREEGERAVLFGTSSWLCYIEFETEDGQKITNRFFPADTDNDYIGRRVDIAYNYYSDFGTVYSTRTEYISSVKNLRSNLILIIVFAAGCASVLVMVILKVRRSS